MKRNLVVGILAGATLWGGYAAFQRARQPDPGPTRFDGLGRFPDRGQETGDHETFRSFLRARLTEAVPNFPETLSSERGNLQLQYSFHPRLQRDMTDLIRRYAPDYAAAAAVEASTGRVLALVSFAKHNDVTDHLALKASFPAASIFKVVTAAAALEQGKLDAKSVIAFNGSSHTLYKKNVEQTRYDRWTRYMSVKDAFARSINTVFGKLGAFHAGPEKIAEVASRFGFNQSIESELPFESGVTQLPMEATPYEIAEVASGFNRDSSLSVLHGALIAAAVATDGLLMRPSVVDAVTDPDGQPLYRNEPAPWARTMTFDKARQLRELMRATVEAGTSRKSFRQVRGLRRVEDIEVGGKTGSLHGGKPFGKCDWFVGYLRHEGEPLALAVLTVNPDKWTVKSSYLAARFFEDYLETQSSAR